MATARRMFEYLSDPFDVPQTDVDYSSKPINAFFVQTVHLCDSLNHCKRHFAKKKDGDYTKDSRHALNILSCSLLASIMGNFETFERSLFAGLFEVTELIPGFDIKQCIKRLKDETSVNVDAVELSAYRGHDATAGIILADRLGNWHNPPKVSAYFRAMFDQFSGFTASDSRDLAVLWQIRHSIVHSGGAISRPDAQKVPDLKGFGEHEIIVPPTFVEATARRMHRVVKRFITDLKRVAVSFSGPAYADQLKDALDDLLELESPRRSWLR